MTHGADGTTLLEHRDSNGALRRVLDSGCGVAMERTDPAPGPTADDVQAFTDETLRSSLRRLKRAGARSEPRGPRALVVYAWSPHMPLSVDGYREIQTAADATGALVVPVLFAGSDHAFARREARRVGMPEEGLREIASLELIMRDAQLHAPSIVVFGGDRVSPVLPGYRDADGYRRYLEAFLGQGLPTVR